MLNKGQIAVMGIAWNNRDTLTGYPKKRRRRKSKSFLKSFSNLESVKDNFSEIRSAVLNLVQVFQFNGGNCSLFTEKNKVLEIMKNFQAHFLLSCSITLIL